MTPVKCTVCGGELINDYKTGISRCGHCGNKWPLAETDPGFMEYGHIIGHINKADDLAGPGAGLKQTEEALLMYKNAMMECSLSKPSEAVNSLKQICKDAIENCEKQKTYLAAKEHMENGAYAKAYKELSGLDGFDDLPQLMQQCSSKMAKERMGRIPYSIAVGLILPAVLFFFIREKTDLGNAETALIFITAAAADIFVIFLNNGFSTALEIISFVLLVPLLLFAFFAYVLHFASALAAVLAIGIPIILIIIFGFFVDK